VRPPSAWFLGVAIVAPGLLGGLGIIFGLPAVLLLLLTAGGAGFLVAHPGGGERRMSALAGAAANLVSFMVVSAPFLPTILADPEFRVAALSLATVVVPLFGVGLGFGALVGYGGAFVARDVARRTAS
jgi:hypothetical protein